MSDKKIYVAIYNDSSLKRTKISDDHIIIKAEDAFEAHLKHYREPYYFSVEKILMI